VRSGAWFVPAACRQAGKYTSIDSSGQREEATVSSIEELRKSRFSTAQASSVELDIGKYTMGGYVNETKEAEP
jgi:hypothetical protein